MKGILRRLLIGNYHVAIYLKCPDGLEESRGFDIPKDLNGLMKFINAVIKNGYSVRAELWDSASREKRIIEGYQPIYGRLNTSNPPQGGSGVQEKGRRDRIELVVGSFKGKDFSE